MSNPILEVRGLKKFFPITSGLLRHEIGSVKAVNDIDFTIYKNEVLGMVGESGSGKSTACRAAIRLIEPSAGKINFLGDDFMQYNQKQLRAMRMQVQMVFQDPFSSLNPRKSIGDSIGEALIYHRLVKDRSEQLECVANVLQKVGLSPDSMDLYPHQFSGGQQQRICIGRAIAVKPKFIVCDEAVSALDVSVRAQILNLLIDLKESLGLSYLFISHDLSIIRHICDRVIVIYLGKVMESATIDELFANPMHPYTQALFSAIPKENPRDKKTRIILKGDIPSSIDPPSGCPFRTRCPYAQPICAQKPPRKHVSETHYYDCIL